MRVELRDLGKTYDGERWAVRGLTLTIPSGSIVGLIGPNGAGKSTTLRMLATVLAPSDGSIAFDGVTPGPDKTALRRQIGFLGDGNPLYKHMSPAEYLRFFGQCFKLPPAELEPAIAEMLTTFDLTERRDTPAGALSKGMRQRLLIARCLLHGPRLLILDEPADGLDPRGRSDLRAILARTRERGVTVLISSHILRELDDLCDQTVILQQGKLVVAGEVADIIERYEVRRFVYQLRLLAGGPAARELLARRRVLVEAEGVEDGCETLSIQVQGGEELMADILAELCAAGVRVVTVSRVRSRLEDVYNRISDDRVA
ncbi:MAG: ABC transporter ATP-binding protein [Nannocystis sp.]|uniref:ABC transporter ATP-binding protein n=1 Tax=Nannocystis sp. TaxID=1962667 RepID=UPI0024271CA8|nr:ABC transporter ATP-binding protein [Nannocystis sp.]MBK9756042.1 ABC transporter ATP-binding protein [Nannocystis sp.]